VSLLESHRRTPCRRTQRKSQASRLSLLVMAGLPKDGDTTPKMGQNRDNDSPVTAYEGQLIQYEWKLKTTNYSDETTQGYVKNLRYLIHKEININEPNDVTAFIAIQKWSNGTKAKTINAYRLYCKQNNIQATLPTYKTEQHIPFIPLENELDQLISGCKHQLATFLEVLKETAARYGEALRLQWTNLDTEAMTLTLNNPEKNSNPRSAKITTKLLAMLSTLPHTNTKIFQYEDKDSVRKAYMRARTRIAKNTGNSRILQIHFHTFRHWKATQLYHRTNNLMLVKKLLGHKNLNNTQIYIQLLPDQPDDYSCEIATNVTQAAKLVQDGYDYVTGEYNDGGKLFRKRK